MGSRWWEYMNPPIHLSQCCLPDSKKVFSNFYCTWHDITSQICVQLHRWLSMTMGATCTIIAWTENHSSLRIHGFWWIDFIGLIIQVSIFICIYPKPTALNSFFFLLACSVGYNLSSYPQFSAVNSQVVEQSNSLLKRIRSTISYMSATNFVKHCALFFWYHNKTKSTSLYEVTCVDHWFCPVEFIMLLQSQLNAGWNLIVQCYIFSSLKTTACMYLVHVVVRSVVCAYQPFCQRTHRVT